MENSNVKTTWVLDPAHSEVLFKVKHMLNWNAALEAGGVLVSDEVRINAEVQFTRQN